MIPFVGNYWIDPNGGVRNDAVLAFCHFESLSSCVLPKNLKVCNLHHSLFSTMYGHGWEIL